LNVYGESKAAAERAVLTADPSALVVRTSAFFGPWDEHNFVTRSLRALASGREWTAADDAFVSPTYVPDLVDASLDLLIDGESGIWHLTNNGAVTWAELARRAAARMALDPSRVLGCPQDGLALVARRPGYSVLQSRRAFLMPSLDHALDRYVEESGLGLELRKDQAAGIELLEA
jgi:dTDP-4-dehydrorhamnose reductase